MATSLKRPRQRSKRGFFLRGLAVVLPAVLTVFLFVTVAQFADRYVAGPINRAIYTTLDSTGAGWTILEWSGLEPLAPEYLLAEDEQREPIRSMWRKLGGPSAPDFTAALENHREEHTSFIRDLPELGIDPKALRASVEDLVGIWVGIVIAAGLILFVGYLASGFLGRAVISGVDRTLSRLPLVRSVYPHAKKLVDFFLSESEMTFDAAVAVPYPGPGIWSIGFVTGAGLKELNEAVGGERVAVYIPSSPLPMTGYTIFLEADKLLPLALSVEEAFRLVVSVGVLVPDEQRVTGSEETLARLGISSHGA